VEYLSQAVRAKAEECLAAVDDGELSLAKCVRQHMPKAVALNLNAAYVVQPVFKLGITNSFNASSCQCCCSLEKHGLL